MEITEKLRGSLLNARSICVLTGAGISAESGVPTFRGDGQNTTVWKGLPFDQISSARMVEQDLPAVWEWFDYRRGVLSECKPNPAHRTLVSWQDRYENFTLVTQNVDGLHDRAGSMNVLELHGNINRSRCVGCDKKFFMKAEEIPHSPSVCDECEEKTRPDVVLFGEMLPAGVYEQASVAAAGCDLFFVVGTSALVYPAAMLPEIAKRSGAYTVEINLEPTPLTNLCDSSLTGKAGEILPALEGSIFAGNPE